MVDTSAKRVSYLLGFAAIASLTAASGCTGIIGTVGEPETISCTFTRDECLEEETNPQGGLTCTLFASDIIRNPPTPPLVVTATTCYNPATDGSMTDKCTADFCGSSQSRTGFNGCKVTAASLANVVTGGGVNQATGTCLGQSGAKRLAAVEYETRFRQCVPTEVSGAACGDLEAVPASGVTHASGCFDARTALLQPPSIISPYPATSLGPPFDQDGTINILSITLDSLECAAITTEADDVVYAVTPGLAATATGAGVTAPVTATGGEVIVKQDCSDDVFGCVPVSLNQLRVNVANMTVAGASLGDVVVSNTTPAAVTTTFNSEGPPTFSVAGGALNLLVSGTVAGVRSSFVTGTTAPLALTATSSGFGLTGTFAIHNVDASGKPLTVTVGANISGTPANAQQLACAGETGIQRLFGFEDALSWSSTQATLSPVTAPVTQGCGALGIAGQGYMTIASAPFATSALTPGPALSVDLFIPGNQPNQFYLGALQMYLSCPSGNVFNAYIGQAELTGKPQNAYSTFRYPLPSTVTSTLQKSLSDCSVSLALNVNQTGRSWILDNLRFTP